MIELKKYCENQNNANVYSSILYRKIKFRMKFSKYAKNEITIK